MAITKVSSGLISADASSIDLNIDAGTLYLDVSENRVGIGTTSPSKTLHVNGELQLENNLTLNENSPAIVIPNGDLRLFTGGTESMRIDSSGNVGIGETSPDNILHIKTTASGGPQIQMGDGTNYAFMNFDGTSLQISTQRDMADGTWYNTSKSWGGINIVGASTGSYITFKTANDNNTSPSERMRIDSSGNVGIGTSSPFASARLQVNTGTNLNLAVQTGTTLTNGMKINAFNNAANANIPLELNSSVMLLKTGETERMRIDSDGIMLLGTTTRGIGILGDANVFGVAGNSGSAFPMVVFDEQDPTVEGGSCILELSYSGDNSFSNSYYALFSDSGGTQGSISGTGGGTVAYNTSSDSRLKENIVDTSSQLDKIKQVQVRDFNYIGKDVTNTGMIAQELNEIIPEVVTEGLEDATKHPWGVDYGKLTPYLIKAIQEQQTIIDDLKTRIETLENV